MFRRLGQLFARIFGSAETLRQQREIIDLARQAGSFPDNERLIIRLADSYLRAGDKERALSAYWHVVDIYKKRSDWQKAAAVLKRVLLLAPAESVAHFEIAQCFEKMNRRREAAQEWEQAGLILRATQDVDGTVRCFSRALSLDPSLDHLARELARLRPSPKIAPASTPLPRPSSPPKLASPRIAPAKSDAPKVPPPTPKIIPSLQPALEPTRVRPNLASLGRAQVREAVPATTLHDDPLDAFDLGLNSASTTEYSAEDLGTLLDHGFGADTVAVDAGAPYEDDDDQMLALGM